MSPDSVTATRTTDPRYAALLIFNDTANDAKPSDQFALALKAALDAHPDDPLIRQVATVYRYVGYRFGGPDTHGFTRLGNEKLEQALAAKELVRKLREEARVI